MSIDRTNEAAATELGRVVAAQAAGRKARESALKEALKSTQEAASTEIKLKPFPKEPLAHFRITADSKKVFDALGKLAGLNVAFTSTFRPTPQFSVDLTDVTIEEALKHCSPSNPYVLEADYFQHHPGGSERRDEPPRL